MFKLEEEKKNQPDSTMPSGAASSDGGEKESFLEWTDRTKANVPVQRVLSFGDYTEAKQDKQEFKPLSYDNSGARKTSGGYYSFNGPSGGDYDRAQAGVQKYGALYKQSSDVITAANHKKTQYEKDLKAREKELASLNLRARMDKTGGAAALYNQRASEYQTAYGEYKDFYDNTYKQIAGDHELIAKQYGRYATAYNGYNREAEKQREEWKKTVRDEKTVETELEAARERVENLKRKSAGYNKGVETPEAAAPDWTSPEGSRRRELDAQRNAVRETKINAHEELEEAQEAVKLLEEERQYSEFFKWNRLRENDDFAEKSKYVSTANGKEPVTYVDFDSGTLLYEESGYDDIYYDYINGVEDAVKKVDAEDGTFHTSHHGWRDLPENVVKLYNYVYATQGKEKAQEYINYATTREYTGLEAMMYSFFDASGLNSATKTVEGLDYALTGNEERKESNRKHREEWEQESKEAAAQYPGLYNATNMAVNIGKMALIGGAVGKIPAIANLAPAARAAATGAATFGLSTALDEAGDAVTGKIKPGDYAFDVLTSAAAGGAGGALSGAAGRFASDFLLSHGLSGNQVARAAMAGLPGLASAAGRTAVTETASFARDPENYSINWDALAQRAVVSYAFGVLGYIVNNAGSKEKSLAETGTNEAEDLRPESEYFKDCKTLEELNAARRQYAKEYADVYNSQSPNPERQNIVKSINSDYERQANWFKQQAPEVFERAQEAYQNGDAEEARAETGELMVILESIQEDVNTGILQADGAQEALDALSSIVGDMRAATATQSGNDGEGKLLLTDAKPKNDSQTQDRVQELQRRYREAIDAGEKNTASEAETAEAATSDTPSTGSAALDSVLRAISDRGTVTNKQAMAIMADRTMLDALSEITGIDLSYTGQQASPVTANAQITAVKNAAMKAAESFTSTGNEGVDTLLAVAAEGQRAADERAQKVTELLGITPAQNEQNPAQNEQISTVEGIEARQQELMNEAAELRDAGAITPETITRLQEINREYQALEQDKRTLKAAEPFREIIDKGGNRNVTEGMGVHDDGMRADNQGSEGQSQSLYREAGRTEANKNSGRARSTKAGYNLRSENDSGSTQKVTYGETVHTSYLGIKNGSDYDAIRLVIGENADIREAREILEDAGIEPVFFGGGNLHIDGMTARGALSDGKAYIRVDDPRFSAQQIALHERAHAEIAARGDEAIYDLEDQIVTRIGEEALNYAMDIYRDALQDANMTHEEILEELIADALADMNEAAGAGQISRTMDGILGDVKAEADDYLSRTEKKSASGSGGEERGAKFSGLTAEERLDIARELLDNGGSPSTVFNETGIVVMASGDLRDGFGGKIIGRYNDGRNEQGRVLESGDGGRVRSTERDSRGGVGGYSTAKEKTIDREWRHLDNKTRNEISSFVQARMKNAGEEGTALLRQYGSIEAFTKDFYSMLQINRVVAEQWSPLIPDIQGLMDEIESAVSDEDNTRYSRTTENGESEIARLTKENRKLEERVTQLNGQTVQTKSADEETLAQIWKKDSSRLAKQFKEEFSSTMQQGDIAKEIRYIAQYLLQGEEDGHVIYGKVREMASSLASKLVNSASVLSEDYDAKAYSEFKDALRGGSTKEALILNKDYKGDFDAYGGWNNWRKTHFGRVNVKLVETGDISGRSIDSVYKELSENYAWILPKESEVSTPFDQLMAIVAAEEALRPVYENPYSTDLSIAVEDATNQILETLLDTERFWDKPSTFADREAIKRQQLQDEADDRVKKAVEREADKRREQVAKIRKDYAEANDAYFKKKADSEARQKLLKTAQRLKKMKTTGAVRAEIDGLIGNLDTVAVSLTGRKASELRSLEQWYNEQLKDPDWITNERVKKDLARLSNKHISEMSLNDVHDLTNALLHIENEQKTAKKLINEQDQRDTSKMGDEIIRNVKNSRGVKATGLAHTFDSLVVNEVLSPVRMIRKITGYVASDPLYKATLALDDGQTKAIDYRMNACKPFNKWMNNKKFIESITGSNAKEIKITAGGGVFTITPSMRMSLYLHSLNDQNLMHIKLGGVTIPDIKLYKKGKVAEAYARGATVKMTPTEVKSIASHMTAEEREFANAIRKYFNETSKNAINKTSVDLLGYPLAEVDNYFPINTNSAFIKDGNNALIKFDGSIEGQGWTKERIKAANPILLRGAEDVLLQSIDQHARYVGMAIPVRNINKLLGVTQHDVDESGRITKAYTGSVAEAVENKWGAGAWKYVQKMLADVQGVSKGADSWGQILNKVRSNYAAAVLTYNASVAMKQAASYPTAAAVLGWGPLAKAMKNFGKVDLELIAKYTPLQWWRSQGYSTQELGDIKNQGKSIPALLNWIQGIDLLTTRKLWKASEYYVQDHNSDLKVGTEEYYQAVADIYNRVLKETQPNYDVMQRPQLLRSENELVKSLAMFKTQPFQNFNIVYDAWGQMDAAARAYKANANAETKAAYKEAEANFGRAVSSQLVSAAVFAAMTFAWNAFRGKLKRYKDKDGEVNFLSVLAGVGKSALESLVGMVPFGSDLFEAIDSILSRDTYYGFSNVTESALGDLVKGINSVAGVFKDDEIDANELRLKLGNLANYASKVFGAPVENVTNIFNATFRWAAIAAEGQYKGEYAYLRLTESPSSKSADYYDLLYKAYNEDEKSYRDIYRAMVDSEDFDEKKIRSAMEDRMKKEAGVKKVEELPHRWLTPDQQEQRDEIIDMLVNGTPWKEASEKQRRQLEEEIFDLLTENTNGERHQEKIDKASDYGISNDEYLGFRLALKVVDKPTKSGEYGSYSVSEIGEAINMLDGLTDDEKLALAATQMPTGFNLKTDEGNPTSYAKLREMVGAGLDADTALKLRSDEIDLDTYLRYARAGVDPYDSVRIVYDLKKLKPLEGAKTVKTYQKWRVALDNTSGYTAQIKAIEAATPSSEAKHITKMKVAHEYGMSPDVYVTLKEWLPEFDENGNGSYSGAEVQAAIDGISGGALIRSGGGYAPGIKLSNKQKAALWQLFTGNKSAKNNPYDLQTGRDIIEAMSDDE